jgi:hypothetical protein
MLDELFERTTADTDGAYWPVGGDVWSLWFWTCGEGECVRFDDSFFGGGGSQVWFGWVGDVAYSWLVRRRRERR